MITTLYISTNAAPLSDHIKNPLQRDQCLAALKSLITSNSHAAFGLDFPFGLPETLINEDNWEEFILKFPEQYSSPDQFRQTCHNATDNKELKRVTEYQNNGWPPFPGFLISDEKRPQRSPVAVAISGSCNFFSSNRTSNMFAFCVKPGASFTVIDHFQEIKDVSGQEFKYKVDLAFIIGIAHEESWESIQKRLLELFKHSLNVWRDIV